MTTKNKQNINKLTNYLKGDLGIHVFNSDDNKNLKWHYSPTMFPKLTIKRNNVEYDLDVTVNSVEDEDKRLLHHLLVKTREQS